MAFNTLGFFFIFGSFRPGRVWIFVLSVAGKTSSAWPEPVIHVYDSRYLGNMKDALFEIHTFQTVWRANGWRVRVLTEKDAQKHKDFEVLNKSFYDLPTTNARNYEAACFLRHLALAAVGGGWAADIDVVPIALPASIAFNLPNHGKFSIYCGFVPCLISGTAEEYLRVSHLLANLPWREHKKNRFTVKGKDHVSDMHGLSFLAQLNPPEVLTFSLSVEEPVLLGNVNNIIDCSPASWSSFNASHTNPLVVHNSHFSMHGCREKNLSHSWFMGLNSSQACKSRTLLMLLVSAHIQSVCTEQKIVYKPEASLD
eukprot:gb/GEZN01008186.1/.p1 GENE.gb/GEZN01008186.1/~~gb/GEZN01008186.1/.p1  ORF type:complete len:312 (-),score=14.79 gb/GEZN01008186.1/:340-1275(-)